MGSGGDRSTLCAANSLAYGAPDATELRLLSIHTFHRLRKQFRASRPGRHAIRKAGHCPPTPPATLGRMGFWLLPAIPRAKSDASLLPPKPRQWAMRDEQLAESSGNIADSETGGAKSGALSADLAPIDPDLAVVVDAWPTLPADVRCRIVAIIRASQTPRRLSPKSKVLARKGSPSAPHPLAGPRPDSDDGRP
jgi:hypothetical protein